MPTEPPLLSDPSLSLAEPVPTGDGAAACPACGAAQVGAYCHACGQHFLEGRITIRRLVREFSERFLKLERGLLGTFVGLCRGPGTLARRYVEGCRRPYVNPLSYVFLGAAVSLLFLPLVMGGADGDYGGLAESMDLGIALASAGDPERSPEQQAVLDETMEQALPILMESMMETMRQLNAIFAFAAALLMAAFFRLFFGARTTYAETAVATLYGTGHYYLLAVPLALVTLWLPNGMWIYTGLTGLLFGVIAVWTALGFYGRSWGTAGLAGLSFVATYVLYAGGVMGLAGVVSAWRVMPEVREIAETVRAAHGL
ncbi:DUF3667 domain-containing protein [Rubrivirga sp.]|uniref:DUF3667 domain-containing protein n=1 Tax=Rubrivirga sp. TaxID=1885344 RepID=UPI003B52398E